MLQNSYSLKYINIPLFLFDLYIWQVVYFVDNKRVNVNKPNFLYTAKFWIREFLINGFSNKFWKILETFALNVSLNVFKL